MRTFSLAMYGIAVVGMVLHFRFLRIMRLRHAVLWRSLGKPRWFSAINVLVTPRVLRFLWDRDFQGVPDHEFTTLSSALRLYYLIFFCIFGVFVIALAMSARPTI